MNREEALEILLEQLKKVPNREVCKCATAEEIIRIFEEINFGKIYDFIFTGNLALKISEIPEDQKFEVILYFSKFSEIERVAYWYLCDYDDDQTEKWHERSKEILEIDWFSELFEVDVDTLLEYAKSDKPDL